MSRNSEQILKGNLRKDQTQKWKNRSQILGILMIATSGLICAIGGVDNLTTQNFVTTSVMDVQIVLFTTGEVPHTNLGGTNYRSLEAFSRTFIGKIQTRCVLIPLSFEFEPQIQNPPLNFSFFLIHENRGVVENLTLSFEILNQLKEIRSGITLEATGDPGEFEIGAEAHPSARGWQITFQLIVQAIVLSPQIEYLGTVFSLLLAGITLLLFGSVKWGLNQMSFAIGGLSGMIMGVLLVRYSTQIYSFYNLQYLGITFLLFIVCLVLVFKSFSRYK